MCNVVCGNQGEVKTEQLMFLHRSLHSPSPNEVVCDVACVSCLWRLIRRMYTSFSLCTGKYNELKCSLMYVSSVVLMCFLAFLFLSVYSYLSMGTVFFWCKNKYTSTYIH